MGESTAGAAVNRPGSPQSRMVGYVLPFVLLIIFLTLRPLTNLPVRLEFALRAVVVGGVILTVSRPLVRWRFAKPAASTGLGILVFLLWVAPDTLYAPWHHWWPFENPITGSLSYSLPSVSHTDPLLIALRSLQAIVLVPIAEELFWRGFLMRWLIHKDFETVEFGTYSAPSFWISALLFASEHGALWDVGLMAGISYNWWAIRTRSIADCILAHAVTNAVLCLWVVMANRWEYWP
ncbi:MAG: CAAX prenyl protease-related protein [Bryobacterales bacterium]|nr:CAAX prenyl protease-related protein [Bryobacterales bacterium]